ncbi:ubiquitin-associated protein 1-like [Dysidea avara]|uniref:ubiquitin-associated protein 1-like n=1 Tax=Dysidea avara TaxID=196820 RepID=UPI0033215D10
MMLQRQGTITHPSTSGDSGLSRDHVIRGVDVRLCFSNVHIQEFTVPKSYYQPVNPNCEDFTFNFDLEKKVLEQAKNFLISTERENVSGASQNQFPFLPTSMSAMLVPDRVEPMSSTTVSVNNQTLTQSLREFEGDNSDPFETVQLQTIDDMAELQSVLQPNVAPVPTTSWQPSVTSHRPVSTVGMGSNDGILVDLSDTPQVPISTSQSHATRQPPPPVAPRHRQSTDVIPPVPKPRSRSKSPLRNDVQPSVTPISTGVRVLPPIGLSTSSPQLPSYSGPTTASTPLALPTYDAAMSSKPPPPPPPKPQEGKYILPDPTSSMSAQEADSVSQMASMGFPGPRVARTLKRLKDSAKVLDFLVLVSSLEEEGRNGDSIETALIMCDNDPNDAKKYLECVDYYKELGFPERKIHTAYEKSDKDWDKIIDILIGDT